MLTRTLIDERQRHTRPIALLGETLYYLLEPRLYMHADALIEGYRGAYWDMYELSNGGFYMAPSLEGPLTLQCPNTYRGGLTPEAAGLVLCLYSYSHLSFNVTAELQTICADQYHWLRDYALEHTEGHAIFLAID